MNPIIKNHALCETDAWQVISDNTIDNIDSLPEGDLILPLSVWQKLQSSLSRRNIGVWLNSDEQPSAIQEACQKLPIIAINFPIFSDGRGYSYAHVLRAQYGFAGDLRAIGDVLKDQLFFMNRCGFSSFQMRQDQALDQSLARLRDFSNPYQAANDNNQPLFRSRK